MFAVKAGLPTFQNRLAVLAAGVVATSIALEYVRTKSIYKAGKIDQEYTDKAKLQKTLA